MAEEFGMGFGDEEVVQSRVDNWKGTSGYTYRLAFPWLFTYGEMKARFEQAGKKHPEMPEGATDDDPAFEWEGSIRFIAGNRWYKEGCGYILDPEDEELKARFRSMLGEEPGQQIGTIVCVYATDKDGELYKDEDTGKFLPLKYEVLPWVFGRDKYDRLRKLNKKFALRSYDIEASCTDTQYQKMDFNPHTEGLWARKDERKAKILKEVAKLVTGGNPNLGIAYSLERLQEKLGISTPDSGGDAGAAVSNEDIDELLDDI
jgi:hypothetical protein